MEIENTEQNPTPKKMKSKTNENTSKTQGSIVDSIKIPDFLESELIPSLGETDESAKSKTSLRMLYEAQTKVIKGQIGDLESIRLGLGLSQRKMAQLLLVDPSAWSRWIKNPQSVPPQVYRALQWYLALNEKIPGLTPSYFLIRDFDVKTQEKTTQFEDSLKNQKEEFQFEILKLKNQLLIQKKLWMKFYILTLVFMAGLFSIFFIFKH
jgi:transcriptional regulator with XRE-family HTH domain